MKNLKFVVVLVIVILALFTGCDNSSMVSTPPDQDEAGGEVIIEGGAPEVRVTCTPAGSQGFVTEAGTQFLVSDWEDTTSEIFLSNYSKSEEVFLDQLAFDVIGKGDCLIFSLYNSGLEKIGTALVFNGKLQFRVRLVLPPWTALRFTLTAQSSFFCEKDVVVLRFNAEESSAEGLSSGLKADLWSPDAEAGAVASHDLTAVATMPMFSWRPDTPTGQTVGGYGQTIAKIGVVNPTTKDWPKAYIKGLGITFVPSFSVYNAKLSFYKESVSFANKIGEETVSWEGGATVTIFTSFDLPLFSGTSKEIIITLDTIEMGYGDFLFFWPSGVIWSDSQNPTREFYELPSIPMDWRGLER